MSDEEKKPGAPEADGAQSEPDKPADIYTKNPEQVAVDGGKTDTPSAETGEAVEKNATSEKGAVNTDVSASAAALADISTDTTTDEVPAPHPTNDGKPDAVSAKPEKTPDKAPTASAPNKESAEAQPSAEAKTATPAAEGVVKPAPAKPAADRPAAAKAAKAPPPPDPKVEAAKAEAEKLATAVTGKLGTPAVEESGNAHYKPMVRIRREDWAKAVDMLRTHPDWKLDYIECMAGTDYPEYIEVVVFAQSTSLGHFVCLKTRTPRENAEVPTLVDIHPGVNWEEREIYDLLGVTFTNHPDLRRIMMWEEFKGHPLRKDYSEWD